MYAQSSIVKLETFFEKMFVSRMNKCTLLDKSLVMTESQKDRKNTKEGKKDL